MRLEILSVKIYLCKTKHPKKEYTAYISPEAYKETLVQYQRYNCIDLFNEIIIHDVPVKPHPKAKKNEILIIHNKT